MKIDRLRTLDQFRKYLRDMSDEEFVQLNNLEDDDDSFDLALCRPEINSFKWDCFNRYADYVQNSLTKSMFVNEIEKPKENDVYTDDFGPTSYYGMTQAWQEAEKKVIFEGFEFNKILNEFKHYNPYIQFSIHAINQEKLYELAEKTFGQLKLKNVEI